MSRVRCKYPRCTKQGHILPIQGSTLTTALCKQHLQHFDRWVRLHHGLTPSDPTPNITPVTNPYR